MSFAAHHGFKDLLRFAHVSVSKIIKTAVINHQQNDTATSNVMMLITTVNVTLPIDVELSLCGQSRP